MSRIVLATFNSARDADQALYELEHFHTHPVEVVFDTHTQRLEDRTEVIGKSMIAGVLAGAAIGGIAGVLAASGAAPGLAGIFIGGVVASGIGLVGAASIIFTGLMTGIVFGLLLGFLTGLLLPREVMLEGTRLGTAPYGLAIINEAEVSQEVFEILEKHHALKMGLADFIEVEQAVAPASEPVVMRVEEETEAASVESPRDEAPQRYPSVGRNQMVFGERRSQRTDIDTIRPSGQRKRSQHDAK